MASKSELDRLNELAVELEQQPKGDGESFDAFIDRLQSAMAPPAPPAPAEGERLTIRQAINQAIDTLSNTMQRERKHPGTMQGLLSELRQGLNDMEGHPLLDK